VLLLPKCVTEYQNGTSIIINKPYNEVLLNLSKKDLLYNIIESQNGQVVGQRINSGNLEIHKILTPQWTWNATNFYEIKPSFIMADNLHLKQVIKTTEKIANIEVSLCQSNKNIKKLLSKTTIEPIDKNHTKITLSYELHFQCKAPNLYHEDIHKEVEAQCDKNIESTVGIIKEAAETKTLISIPFGERIKLLRK
jgi:hypothetical protein